MVNEYLIMFSFLQYQICMLEHLVDNNLQQHVSE